MRMVTEWASFGCDANEPASRARPDDPAAPHGPVMSAFAGGAEHTFAKFGLSGTPGSEAFWDGVRACGLRPRRGRRLADTVPPSRISGEHRFRELVGPGAAPQVGGDGLLVRAGAHARQAPGDLSVPHG